MESSSGASDGRAHPLQYVIPLYFMQALPVFLVQDVSKTIFKGMGVDNPQIAAWTALIALPWSFKLLWGPIVELNGTKRLWINATQLGIGALILLAALALQTEQFFGVTVAVLAVIAVFSATCDIATDGYYLLTTNRTQQKVFVGWQSTMFRLGRLFATGGVVWAAGYLIEQGIASRQGAWLIALGALAVIYMAGAVINLLFLPRPELDVVRQVDASEKKGNFLRVVLVIASFGFFYFGLAFFFGLVGHLLSAVPLLSKWELKGDAQMILFFVKVWEGPSLVVHGLNAVIGAVMGTVIGRLALSAMRGSQVGAAFGAFFGQRDLWRILLFVLFYRFGEAMLSSIVPLFLQDKRDGPADPTQGLGFVESQVGIVNGTFGVVGIVLGGIVGGWAISKIGLRRSFWILAAAMNVPNLLYVWAAFAAPDVQAMSAVMFFDQFGYGFGFAGYLICLQAIAQRNPLFTTAHYAICTGLGALLIASAGTLSGALMASLDFQAIFVVVLFFTIPCLLTLKLIPAVETDGIQVANTDVAD